LIRQSSLLSADNYLRVGTALQDVLVHRWPRINFFAAVLKLSSRAADLVVELVASIWLGVWVTRAQTVTGCTHAEPGPCENGLPSLAAATASIYNLDVNERHRLPVRDDLEIDW